VWSASRPGRFASGKDPVPIVQEAGWAPGRSGCVRKISPPPGFDPQAVQPVASRYNDRAIPVRSYSGHSKKYCLSLRTVFILVNNIPKLWSSFR
jgi:hypothetical protein